MKHVTKGPLQGAPEDSIMLMGESGPALEPILRRIIPDGRGRRMIALMYLNITRLDLSPETRELDDESLIRGIVAAYQEEERRLEELKPNYLQVEPEAQKALRLISSEFGVEAPDFRRFKPSYGFWHQASFSLASCLAHGRPITEMSMMLSSLGEYSPTLDWAVVKLDGSSDGETNQPGNIRKTYMHEGLHQMGYEIRAEGGHVIEKGIGRSGQHEYDRGILEEGLVSTLANRYDNVFDPHASINSYPNEVALIGWMTDSGVPLQLLTQAHFLGETAPMERGVDAVFGDGFIDFLSGLRRRDDSSKALGYDPLMMHLPTMNASEVRVCMDILRGKAWKETATPDIRPERLEGFVVAHYRYLYLEALAANSPLKGPGELDAAVERLPESLSQRIRSQPKKSWPSYQKELADADAEIVQAAKERVHST